MNRAIFTMSNKLQLQSTIYNYYISIYRRVDGNYFGTGGNKSTRYRTTEHFPRQQMRVTRTNARTFATPRFDLRQRLHDDLTRAAESRNVFIGRIRGARQIALEGDIQIRLIEYKETDFPGGHINPKCI